MEGKCTEVHCTEHSDRKRGSIFSAVDQSPEFQLFKKMLHLQKAITTQVFLEENRMEPQS